MLRRQLRFQIAAGSWFPWYDEVGSDSSDFSFAKDPAVQAVVYLAAALLLLRQCTRSMYRSAIAAIILHVALAFEAFLNTRPDDARIA